MKKLLCALLVLVVALPAGALGESKKKGAALTLDHFAALSYDTTCAEFAQMLEEAGGKPKVKKAIRDDAERYLDLSNGTLEGVAVRSLYAGFTSDGAHPQEIELDITPRASATYLKPGKDYDALLAALTAKLGEPYLQTKGPTSYDTYWTDGNWNVQLRYDNGRREQRKRIALFMGYTDPNQPASEPMPPLSAPAEFQWMIEEQDAQIGQVLTTGPVSMGMTREQVKAAVGGALQSEKGDTLRYDVNPSSMEPFRCEYRFSEAGKLIEITARFTKPPYDPSDVIRSFLRVDDWLRWRNYGKPEQEEPMQWAEGHKYNPLDGSTWIKAVTAGKLTYRSTWTVGGVKIEHTLAGEKGKPVHTIVCRQGE